jgi:hypothetical protein
MFGLLSEKKKSRNSGVTLHWTMQPNDFYSGFAGRPIMRASLLIVATCVLPFFWGWGVALVLRRFWPLPDAPMSESPVTDHYPPPDYQI